jgi:xanthine dehydrogenase accessory factor
MEFSGEVVADKQTFCGKGVSVFIEHIAAVSANARIFRKLLTSLQSGVKCCLITDVTADGTNRRRAHRGVVCEDGSTFGEISCEEEHLFALLQKARSVTVPTLQHFGEQRFFIDPWVVPDTVYLFGAGHVARQVAELTGKAGFRTIVLDDREKFADGERFPAADDIVVLNSFEDCFRGLAINDKSYDHITRERRHENALRRVGDKGGIYGIIGSIRKRDALFKELLDTVSVSMTCYGYCPSHGIMAETPVEIAVSIVAQQFSSGQRKAAQSRSVNCRFRNRSDSGWT